MGAWLDRRHTRLQPSAASSAPPVPSRDRKAAASEIRFVPARWLVLLVGVAWTLVTKGKIARLGLVGLVWSVTPKSVKVVAAAVVASWLIVVVGAVAAITLLALQIS